MQSSDASPSGMHRLLILLCVSIPSFMINLDSNIVAVSLPSIAHSMDANFADIEWVISAYTLSFASFLLPAGALADRFGRKKMLAWGLAIFTLASLICGAAPNVDVLNLARGLQGIGAALQLSAALATLSQVFRGAARASAFAFWGAVIGIAVSLGPVIGGFITEHFGWEWAFYINIPIGVVMVATVLKTLDESSDPDARKLDILGAVTFSSSLFLVTLALISGNHEGWGSLPVIVEFAASAVLFIVFLLAEIYQKRPMLDLSFFRSSTYVGASIATLVFAGALLTMLSYLPIFFQSGLGYSPQGAGLLMLPIAVPLFIVPRLVAAHLIHRYSGRALLVLGLLIVSAGLLWVGAEITDLSFTKLLGGMLLMGIGAGILNGETAKVSMSAIPPERAGMASGVSGTIRFSGIVLGFAVLGALLVNRIGSYVAANLPGSAEDVNTLVRAIASGDLSGGGSASVREIALQSFSHGYQLILLGAGGFALLAALLTWVLVRSEDTAPSSAHAAHAPVE
ncbi:MFS transporter [Pseudomonas sp. NPDC087358]|uniref:MFS transporter n=1 Tax=Pseudomonas sp. NPDC087358 TaxID=3364439 RepID=UPI00384C7FF4